VDAHAELVDGLQGSAWRRRWTTVVVLLRVMLHVLQKVDAAAEPSLQRALDERWRHFVETKPAPNAQGYVRRRLRAFTPCLARQRSRR